MRGKKVKIFSKPTKKEIKVLLALVFIFIFLIILFIIYAGKMGCYRTSPCSDGTYGNSRPYYPCSRCVEPTLKEDILGYSNYYFFKPLIIISILFLVWRILVWCFTSKYTYGK